MTQEDYIKNLLNINDKNIHFYEEDIKIERITKGKVIINQKLIHGYLTYVPDSCVKCGCKNNDFTIIANGFKKNCKVKINKMANYCCKLLLDKQRFYCKSCKHTFIAQTSLVNFHKQISNDVNDSIKIDLMSKSSEKDIAARHNVSTSHVSIILDSISNDLPIKMNGHLPKYLGIDEYKATKDTKSKMALIIVDHDKKNIFDTLNSRYINDIEHYFRLYSYRERRKVEIITIDLYKPYYNVLHKLFPNAIIVPDRFHIVIQFREALDKYRISLSKKNKPNYTKFKKYWKLFLKKRKELSEEKNYSNNFRKKISQKDIVEYLINTDEMLKKIYNIYQGIIEAIENKDSTKFWAIIEHISNDVTKKLKTAAKTMKSMKKYINNAFEQEYSNGRVEGTNNFIKSLIRIAYGYKKFKHLKARIMLCKGYYSYA